MDIHPLLDMMRKSRASDLHLKAGSPPLMRIDGDLHRVPDYDILKPPDLNALAAQIASRAIRDQLDSVTSADFSYAVPGVARFRVNLFRQRGTLSMVMRIVRFEVPPMDRLGVPDVVKTLCDGKNGLVLVTGATGSGKSTTLASMIDYINETKPVHIITIEDPIEYLHTDKMAAVNQRELGIDFHTFPEAIRAALREDPDIILIGEMRDKETIQTCVMAAETGHLVFSTLHTSDTVQTVERILKYFPADEQDLIRNQLALLLRGVLSQRLLPRKSGKGRALAMEVLLGGPTTAKLIRENRLPDLKAVLTSGESGAQTFDRALVALVEQGIVSREAAEANTDNVRAFRRLISGAAASGDLGGLIG